MRRAAKAQDTLKKPFKSPARKTAGTETPLLERKRPVPSSAPSFRLPSTPLSKKPRLSTPSLHRSRRPSRPKDAYRLAVSRDSDVHALLQEKQNLQQQLTQIKEETVLLERAHKLKEKDDAQVVSKLMAKWQIACAAAADDLFVLLKPVMEAHREAQQMGIAGSRFQQESNGQPKAAAECDLQTAEDDGCQEIDIGYMLKQFNIDTELF